MYEMRIILGLNDDLKMKALLVFQGDVKVKSTRWCNSKITPYYNKIVPFPPQTAKFS